MTEVYSCGKTNLPFNVARRITSALLFSLNSSRAWSFCNFPFTVESGLCLKNVHCRYGHRFMHHVVGTHGNVTSVRDVVLVSLLCNLCGSMIMFSWARFEHDDFSLFVSIVVQSLSQGRSQLEPFELAGVVTLPSIAEALLISHVLLSWFPQNQHHHPEWSKCHIFLLPRPIGVSFSPFVYGIAQWTQRHIWPFVICSFVSLPWTHIHPSGGFGLSQRESCHTDPRFRQWLFAIHVAIIISGRLLKYIKACFVCFWPSRWFTRIGKSSLAIKSIVLWSNMIPICVITDITPEIFASFKIWLWIFGFFLLLAWRHHPHGFQRWKSAILLARFRPLYIGVQFHCIFSECPLLLIFNLCTWISDVAMF